jgi:DNA-binding GntR family transcriptional regulator
MIFRMPPRHPQLPHQAVAAALRERLDAGEWLPGEQLPSTRELAEAYGVSHMTTAKAIRALAAEGRVTVVPSWGTFVAEQ